MNLNQFFNDEGQLVSPPVFDGLEKLGLSGQDVAQIAGVSPPTVSKWRNGHVPVPSEMVALLTLVLASYVEDVLDQQADSKARGQVWSFYQRAGLDAAREDLATQETINHKLPPMALRTGAIRFRYWWNVQARSQMPDAPMAANAPAHAAPAF